MPKCCEVRSRQNAANQLGHKGLCSIERITANYAKGPRTHFHGGNMGSNPIGDANQIRNLQKFLIPPQYGFEYGSPDAALHGVPLASHRRLLHRKYSS